MQVAINAAKLESKACFSDDRIYIEKFIQKPRHIEFQILADEDTILKMDDLCKKKKISRSELIRQLIKGSK